MEKAKNEILALFKEYGTLKFLDGDDKIKLYKFICDTKKIFSKENILSTMGIINFALIMIPDNECVLYCFRIDKQDNADSDTLFVINEANKSSKYGKYTLATNGDIDWECRFDIEHITNRELKDILTSFFDSLLRLVVLKRDLKFKKKED